MKGLQCEHCSSTLKGAKKMEPFAILGAIVGICVVLAVIFSTARWFLIFLGILMGVYLIASIVDVINGNCRPDNIIHNWNLFQLILQTQAK